MADSTSNPPSKKLKIHNNLKEALEKLKNADNFEELELKNDNHEKLTEFLSLSFHVKSFHYHEPAHPSDEPWIREGVTLPKNVFKNDKVVIEEFKFTTDDAVMPLGKDFEEGDRAVVEYPHLKRLIIDCAAIQNDFGERVLLEIAEMFPNLEKLKVEAKEQAGEYGLDSGQETLTKQVAEITQQVEKALKTLAKKKPDLEIDIRLLAGSPGTDGYEMQPPDFREARERFSKVGFKEVVRPREEDDDEEEEEDENKEDKDVRGTWNIDFVKESQISENKKLYAVYKMFTMVYRW